MSRVLKRIGLVAAGALLGTAVAGGVAAVPAQASTFPTLVNTAVPGCLQGNPDGTVLLATCDYTPHQQWTSATVTGEPGDVGTTYQVRNLATDQCLVIGEDGGLATAACVLNASQGWLFETRMVNQETGQCIAAESASQLKSVACDPTWSQDNQRWYWLGSGT